MAKDGLTIGDLYQIIKGRDYDGDIDTPIMMTVDGVTTALIKGGIFIYNMHGPVLLLSPYYLDHVGGF